MPKTVSFPTISILLDADVLCGRDIELARLVGVGLRTRPQLDLIVAVEDVLAAVQIEDIAAGVDEAAALDQQIAADETLVDRADVPVPGRHADRGDAGILRIEHTGILEEAVTHDEIRGPESLAPEVTAVVGDEADRDTGVE